MNDYDPKKAYAGMCAAWDRLNIPAEQRPDYTEWLEQEYRHANRAVDGWRDRWRRKTLLVHAYRRFLTEFVEPFRREAMEVSLKYEPCGYYCDPDQYGGGHHDHGLYIKAKFLYGNGIEDYVPEPELVP